MAHRPKLLTDMVEWCATRLSMQSSAPARPVNLKGSVCPTCGASTVSTNGICRTCRYDEREVTFSGVRRPKTDAA